MKESSPPLNLSRINIRNITFFLIGLFLIVFLLRQINLRELQNQILGIRWEYLLAGGGLYFLKACLRAFRLNRISADLVIPYWRALRLSLATSLATQILPLKLGEFSYVYLLKREKETPIPQGISALIVVRLMDLMAVGLIYLALALSIHSQNSTVQVAQAIFFLVALSGGFGILMLISYIAPKFSITTDQTESSIRQNAFRHLFIWLQKFLSYFRAYHPAQIAQWLLLSLLEWLCNYSMFHMLLSGMNIPMTFFQTSTAVTFAAIASALPVNAIGSFGSQEAGWTAALIMLQIDRQMAISTAFSTHILSLGYIIFFGGLAWVSYLIPLKSLHR